MTRPSILAIVIAVLLAAAAHAQPRSTTEAGRFEVGIGPLWIGGSSFGERAATETTATGGSVPIFSTTTSLNAATGVEARLGVRVSERFDVEAVGSYAGPHLVATTTADIEAGAGPFTSEEWVQQYTAGGALLWRVRPIRAHPRWSPFLMAGAEHMRQLHEQQTLLVSGRLYEAGGGVKYLLGSRTRARLKTVGVRADVRAIVRTAGVNTDGRAHVSSAIAASMFVRF